jgi:hypothetical protein
MLDRQLLLVLLVFLVVLAVLVFVLVFVRLFDSCLPRQTAPLTDPSSGNPVLSSLV